MRRGDALRVPAPWAALTIALFVWHHLGGVHAFFEVVSNFRWQLFVFSFAVGVWAAVTRTWLWTAALVAILVVEASALAPLWFADPDPILEGVPTATVLQYNVLYLNEDTDAIRAEVQAANADLVALQEVTVAQWEQLEPELTARYPYVLARPLKLGLTGATSVGKVLLSRSPLELMEIPGFEYPPLAVRTQLAGREVIAVAVHPPSERHSGAAVDMRQRKLAAVTEFVLEQGGPMIILSDLNAAPASTLYSDFVDDLGWEDPRHRVGGGPTYPGGVLNPFGIAIDHIFVSRDIALHAYERGGAGGSDHRSLLATISFFPEE